MTDEGLAAAASAVIVAANRAAGLLEAYSAGATRNAGAARSAADRVLAEADAETRLILDDAIAGATTRAKVVVSAIAPGWGSEPWPSLLGHPAQADILDTATTVRAGALRPPRDRCPDAAVPLLVPLLDRGNVRVVANAMRRRAAEGAVQEIVLRALMATGAGQLSLVVVDPGLSGSLAMFSSLRQANEEVFKPAVSSSEGLQSVLDDLLEDVRRIADMYGGSATDLGSFRRSTGQPIEQYRLVVVLDYPAGLDERTQTRLLTLMRRGPACGISVLLLHDSAAMPATGVDPSAVVPLAATIDLDSNSYAFVDGLDIVLSDPPPSQIVGPALADLAGRIRSAAAPRIDFAALQPESEWWWSESSADRISAVIGRIGHRPIEITLGDETEQKHNILVTGAVGQGKSNLLMALIHSWSIRYSPDELELFLLDFKDGVTLHPLAAHGDERQWLPHARVLGLESDRPFGLAVLEHLVEEFEQRARVIKPYGDNIARFRAARPQERMPRIVLVIDEFQVLFDVDDATAAEALVALDRIARRGRAYGIHLVLASQTLSGVTAMLAKQDGILGQIPIRLALYNSAPESRAALGADNVEASRLRYRGELVVNREFGTVTANQRGVVAFADPAGLARFRATMIERHPDVSRPVVFNGSSPAELAAALQGNPRRALPMLALGERIAVDGGAFITDFSASSGRHLSIVGTGRSVDGSPVAPPAAALQAAALSLAWSTPPGAAEFVVIDLLGASDPSRHAVTELIAALGTLGHPARVVPGGQTAGELAALQQQVLDRQSATREQRVFVVAFGMDRLAQARTFDLSIGGSAIDGAVTIWREGAQVGVHLLGWWSNPRIYNDHIGMDAQGLIDVTMAFKMSNSAVVDLFGPFVSWDSPENRALVLDVALDTDPFTVVPFGAAAADDIATLGADRTETR